MLCVGMGLVLSVLAVYFRDTLHLYGVFLTALMYLTPIFYPVSALPVFAMKIVVFNPLYQIIKMVRDIVLDGTFPSLSQHIICAAWGIISILVGLVIFKKKQDNFVLYL
jgi:ABC-type polysaccharide/polyol phosphate export permease